MKRTLCLLLLGLAGVGEGGETPDEKEHSKEERRGDGGDERKDHRRQAGQGREDTECDAPAQLPPEHRR